MNLYSFKQFRAEKELFLWTLVCLVSVCFSDRPTCPINDVVTQEALFVHLTNSSMYRKWMRPQIEGQVLVNTSIEMYSMASVNERESEFSINFLIDLEWTDLRLALNLCDGHELQDLTIEGSEWHLDRIWSPKLRVPNNKNPAAMDRDAKIILLRISSNGYVRVRKRLVLDLYCQMDFRYYPFDTQGCHVTFISSDLSEEHLGLEWTTNQSFTSDNNFYMNGFEVDFIDLKSGNTKSKNEFFSSITVVFKLKRLWAHYILDIYLPTSLVIIVSWMSFWMEITATPARITLGITTMLTFLTVAKESRENLPIISYVNALDIWFVVCTAFIFLSLVEFSIITYISRAEKRKIKQIKTMRRNISQSQLSVSSAETQFTLSANDGLYLCPPKGLNSTRFPFEGFEIKVPKSPILSAKPMSPSLKRVTLNITPPESPNPDTMSTEYPTYDPLKPTPVEIAESIDRKCRLIFPIMFFVFNLFYWISILC